MSFYRKFNPLMHTSWLTLKLNAIGFEQRTDFLVHVACAEEWCTEHCTARWSYRMGPSYSFYPDSIFFFKSPTDQLLFKLTFGGS